MSWLSVFGVVFKFAIAIVVIVLAIYILRVVLALVSASYLRRQAEKFIKSQEEEE